MMSTRCSMNGIFPSLHGSAYVHCLRAPPSAPPKARDMCVLRMEARVSLCVANVAVCCFILQAASLELAPQNCLQSVHFGVEIQQLENVDLQKHQQQLQ